MEKFEYMEKLVKESNLLFYGELDEIFIDDIKKIIQYIKDEDKENPYLFDNKQSCYWYIVSILHNCDFIDYGTSPRFPWLTQTGKALAEEINIMTKDDFEYLLDNLEY